MSRSMRSCVGSTSQHLRPTFGRQAVRPTPRALTTASHDLSNPAELQAPPNSGRIPIPIIRTLEEMRAWRRSARDRKLDVGIVPTMGALHEGHLNLVRTSLARHPLTVMTLFVNPMQFAPTEDLSKYPRTLQRDLELLSTLLPDISDHSHSPATGEATPTPTPGRQSEMGEAPPPPLVIFNPSDEVMYPLRGNLQDLKQKRGAEVDVKGWGDVMEAQFFKGVATVCTKLFNAVEPDHAYFGQKDIQQALLLRIMLKDLLISHPTPENMHIIPTSRDPHTHLALSSRNAYLSQAEMKVAPTLYRALSTAKDMFAAGGGVTGEGLVSAATAVVLEQQRATGTDANMGLEVGPREEEKVQVELDYIEVFDKETFEPVRGEVESGRELVIAGAIWVGRTRLIDNLLLGWDM